MQKCINMAIVIHVYDFVFQLEKLENFMRMNIAND